MLDLNDFRYFVRVVDCGGFTAASRQLDLPKSTLSYRLQQLEAALGVRLLNRTSRSQSMTDAGRLFYRHAVDMLERAEIAESEVRERLVEPSGTIRLTAAVATSLYALRPILPDFIRRFPKIDIVQHTNDEAVDIVGGSYDMAIRAHGGPLTDSGLVQRSLAVTPWRLFAAPRYLDRHPEPAEPDQLGVHATLSMVWPGRPASWRLRSNSGRRLDIAIEPRLATNDIPLLKAAALDGLGIVALPAYVCQENVATGDLAPVLAGWTAGEGTLTAVIPFRHGVLPSVRALLDYLIAEVPRIVEGR